MHSWRHWEVHCAQAQWPSGFPTLPVTECVCMTANQNSTPRDSKKEYLARIKECGACLMSYWVKLSHIRAAMWRRHGTPVPGDWFHRTTCLKSAHESVLGKVLKLIQTLWLKIVQRNRSRARCNQDRINRAAYCTIQEFIDQWCAQRRVRYLLVQLDQFQIPTWVKSLERNGGQLSSPYHSLNVGAANSRQIDRSVYNRRYISIVYSWHSGLCKIGTLGSPLVNAQLGTLGSSTVHMTQAQWPRGFLTIPVTKCVFRYLWIENKH